MTNIILSTMGSFLARKVLKIREKTTTAITSIVPCQRSNT
jgi:hypothetical protein